MILVRLRDGQEFMLGGSLVVVREIRGSRVVLEVDGQGVIFPNAMTKLPYDAEPTSLESPHTIQLS